MRVVKRWCHESNNTSSWNANFYITVETFLLRNCSKMVGYLVIHISGHIFSPQACTGIHLSVLLQNDEFHNPAWVIFAGIFYSLLSSLLVEISYESYERMVKPWWNLACMLVIHNVDSKWCQDDTSLMHN